MMKSRFLQYLGSKDQTDAQARDDCIICMGSSDDKHGVILGCGHFFCQVRLSLEHEMSDSYYSPAIEVIDGPLVALQNVPRVVKRVSDTHRARMRYELTVQSMIRKCDESRSMAGKKKYQRKTRLLLRKL